MNKAFPAAHSVGGKIMKSLEGQKAPAFSLAGNDGNNHSLDEFKGKTVVVFFYPKDSTPG
jgi:peroxiredoxin Q/BCP